MRRPALVAAICFAAGIAMGHQWYLPMGVAMATAWGLFVVAMGGVWRQWPSRRMGWVLGGLLCILGGVRYESTTEWLPRSRLVAVAEREEEIELLGRIASEPEWVGDDVRVTVRGEQIALGDSAWPVYGEALIRFRKVRLEADYGDLIRLRVRLRRPFPARNPGGFDYREYLERKGIRATGRVWRKDQVLGVWQGEGNGVWKDIVLPIRRAVRRAVARNLSGGPAGLLRGVLLGEKRAVPEAVREAFAGSGVNHVLAVSGLHVGLIAATVLFGVRCMGVGRRATGLATAAALVAYAVVTGLPPSVVRATMMGNVAILGSIGNREGDGLNSLGVAGVGLLVFRPQELFDVGFQLSFVATGGILLLYRPMRSWLPGGDRGVWGKWVCAPLAVSLAAQAATAPLVAAYFGRLAPISLLANLIVVPLMGGAVALGILTVAASVCLPPAATLLNGANWLLLKGAIVAAEMLSRPFWASVSVQKPGAMAVCVYFCLLVLVVPEIRRHGAGRCLVFLCLGAANVWVWGGVLAGPSGLEVLVLDVGQGDAIFLGCPNGRTVLVDGGSREAGMDMGERVIMPFLREKGIRRIDAVIATHAHSDHIGGLVTLLEQCEVGHYLDNGQAYHSWTARRIQELIRERGIKYRVVAAGDSLVGLGGVGAVILHPAPAYVSAEDSAPHGLNNGSVVMRISFGSRSVLLTGDVEWDADEDLLRWGERLRSDVLKSAHHGSKTSSSVPFLGAVGPRTAVVSCGEGNKFGHPDPEVIRRYREMGISVHRTDEEGAIRVAFDGDGVRARGWLERK